MSLTKRAARLMKYIAWQYGPGEWTKWHLIASKSAERALCGSTIGAKAMFSSNVSHLDVCASCLIQFKKMVTT